jgi:arabinofuranosyltransferase
MHPEAVGDAAADLESPPTTMDSSVRSTYAKPDAVPRRGPARRSRMSFGFLLQVGLLPGVIGILGYRRRWISDDGMIYIRPVRQLLAGNGPVLNTGERAEVATSALWQWLLTLGSWASRLDPVPVAVYGGLLLTMLGFGLALAGSRRLLLSAGATPREDGRADVRSGCPVGLPAGALVLLAVPPVWDYATSGLETGLSFAWAGGLWNLLVRLDRPVATRTLVLFAFVAGLGPLVRPELATMSAVFLVVGYLLARPGLGRSLALVGLAVALPFGYEIFRMGYYGLLTPLPGLTKEAGSADWSRGIYYAKDFVRPYWLVFAAPIVVLLLLGLLRRSSDRRARLLLFTPLVSGLILLGYAVRVGGDWMHARMLLLPMFVLLLPVFLVPVPALRRMSAAEKASGNTSGKASGWPERLPAVALDLGTVALVVWFLAAISPLRPPYDDQKSYYEDVRAESIRLTGDVHPTSARDWAGAFPEEASLIDAALSDSAPAGSGPVLLIFGIDGRLHPMPLDPAHRLGRRNVAVMAAHLGATGAAAPLDATVIDQLSLGSPLGAHMELQRPSRETLLLEQRPAPWPGHEKLLASWWTLADFTPEGASVPSSIAASTTPAQLAAARRALSCGRLAELQDSVRQPLTANRFWHNLVGAPARTSLRIPRDPFRAQQVFCG